MHNWIYMSTVSVRVPVILLFLISRILQGVLGEECCSKTFRFFSNKQSLDVGISSCFSLPISSLWRATALLKQFPFSLTTTSFLWGGIYSDAGNRLLKMVPSMNKSFTLPSYQHYFNPFLMKQRLKSADLSPKPFFFWTSKQLFAIYLPRGSQKKNFDTAFWSIAWRLIFQRMLRGVAFRFNDRYLLIFFAWLGCTLKPQVSLLFKNHIQQCINRKRC